MAIPLPQLAYWLARRAHLSEATTEQLWVQAQQNTPADDQVAAYQAAVLAEFRRLLAQEVYVPKQSWQTWLDCQNQWMNDSARLWQESSAQFYRGWANLSTLWQKTTPVI